MADDLLRVTTATPDPASAQALARSAVAAGLAGNAQVIGPVFVAYRHLGELGEGSECQVVLSTTRAAYPALEQHILGNHPWQNPEITAIALVEASQEYARWLREATTTSADGPADA